MASTLGLHMVPGCLVQMASERKVEVEIRKTFRVRRGGMEEGRALPRAKPPDYFGTLAGVSLTLQNTLNLTPFLASATDKHSDHSHQMV